MRERKTTREQRRQLRGVRLILDGRSWALDYLLDDLEAAERERDEALAKLRDREDDAKAVLEERCAPDERHCTCVPHLRAEIKRLRDERFTSMADKLPPLPHGGLASRRKPRGFVSRAVLEVLSIVALVVVGGLAVGVEIGRLERESEREAEAVAQCRDLLVLEESVSAVCGDVLEACTEIVAGGQVISMPPMAVEVKR